MRDSNAEHLRAIANDLRSAGDGVAPAAITLADELWLIALSMDGYTFVEGKCLHGFREPDCGCRPDGPA